MDDIDEGIGSNESCLCNKDNANILDELKGLNNKTSEISKDSNGICQNIETRFSPNGIIKNDLDKVHNSNKNGSSFHSELKGNDVLNGVDAVSSDGHDLIKVEKDDPNETKHEIFKTGSENTIIKKEGGLDDKAILENTKEIIDKNVTKELNTTSVDVKSEKCKIEKQENDKVETEPQSANNGDYDKNSFHIPLDEKLRNSLKGLVAKVKSSEPIKDCTNSENSIEKEETKSGIKLEDAAQDLKCEIDENTNPSYELNSDENSDAILLGSNDQDEEGIFMDLGSDCEELEDSLLSDSPKVEDKSNDITESSEAIDSEVIDSKVIDSDDVRDLDEEVVTDNCVEPVNDTNSSLSVKPTSPENTEETSMEVGEGLPETRNKNLESDPNTQSEETGNDKMVVRNSVQETNHLSVDSAGEDDVIFQKITTINVKTVSAKENSNEEKQCNVNDSNVSNGPNLDSLDDSDVIIVPESISEETKDGDKDKLSNATSDNENISENNDDDVDNDDDDKLKTIETSNTTSSIGERKRAASGTDICDSDSKRKKINISNGISYSDTQIEPTSIELSDSDDGETHNVSSSKLNTADNCIKQSLEEKGPKMITMTEEELDSMVRERVKVYLASQQNSLIAKLAQKIKDLQTTNDLWKRQVKDLQIKVSEVTVLQQKHEKRKAACNALRQIRTRHVAVQVDNGKPGVDNSLTEKVCMYALAMVNTSETNNVNVTSSHKPAKEVSTPPKAPSTPMIGTPTGTGTGTIRLPVPQSSYGSSTLNSQKSPGTKLIAAGYKTPSVKSLLDTTKVQKTVGSITTPSASVASSIIGVVQYQPNFLSKNSVTQGYATLTQALVTQVPTVNTSAAKMQTKTLSVSSPSAKIIDLTDDDDNKNQGRFLALQPGINPRTVLAPGTQIVRPGLQNQTYQVVFSPPSQGVRPGTVSMATAISQTPLLAGMQPVQLATAQPPQRPNLTPGTTMARAAVPAIPAPVQTSATHPAPLPSNTKRHKTTGLKAMLPKPLLSISRVSLGIVLSWNMTLNETHAKVSNYQLFAYQETSAPPVYTLWKKVGDVKALPLPMACTLTQFQVGNKYHFAVRAVDEHQREGLFSEPGSINLTPTTTSK